MRMNDFIVIGGSSGIGLCICERLVAEGKNVICISKSLCPVAGVVNKIADVRDGEAMGRIFSSIERADALIYCAGVSLAAPAEFVEIGDIKQITDVNLTCAMECVRLALPILKNSDKARIALLSSSGGVSPIAFDSFYSATKAGLIKYSEALYLELPKNIRCTAFLIGGTRTRFSFKRKIYECDDSRYEKNLKSAADALIEIEQSGYRAGFVAKKILKKIKADNSPPVVSVGLLNKAMMSACKIMPRRLMLWITKKIYRIGN